MPTSEEARRYEAFLSYSHAADGRLAPALQTALHRFRRPWYRVRTVRVFRDATDLSANPSLWGTIERSLGESNWLILMASPTSAASKWVDRELSWWLSHRSANTLIIALSSGEIEWSDGAGDFDWSKTDALPRRLSGAFSNAPRFIDLRWARSAEELNRRHPLFHDAVASLMAAITGIDKITLVGDDVRHHRNALRLAGAAIALLSALTIALTISAWSAFRASRRAQSRQLAAESALLFRERRDRTHVSAQLAIEGLRRSDTIEAELAVRDAVRVMPEKLGEWRLGNGVDALRFTGSSELVTAEQDRHVTRWRIGQRAPGGQRDVTFSSRAAARTSPDHERPRAALSRNGRWAVVAEGGEAAVVDTTTFQVVHRVEVEADPAAGTIGLVEAVTISNSGRWLAISTDDHTAPIALIDLQHGAKVPGFPAPYQPPIGFQRIVALAFDDRDLRLAAGPDNGSGNPIVRVWSVPDGVLVREVSDPEAGAEVGVTALAFDNDGQRLVVGRGHGVVQQWDVADPARAETTDAAGTAIVLQSGPTSAAGLARSQTLGIVMVPQGGLAALAGSGRSAMRHDELNFITSVTQRSNWLVSSAGDGTARLWSRPTGALAAVGHCPGKVQAADVSSDGELFAGADESGVLRVWSTRLPYQLARGPAAQVTPIDSSWVLLSLVGGVTMSSLSERRPDPPISFTQPTKLEEDLRTVSWNRGLAKYQFDSSVVDSQLSRDGTVLAAAMWPDKLAWLDPTSGQVVRTARIDGQLVRRVIMGPTPSHLVVLAGNLLVIPTSDGSVTSVPQRDLMLGAAFTRNGDGLVTISTRALRWWRWPSLAPVRTVAAIGAPRDVQVLESGDIVTLDEYAVVRRWSADGVLLTSGGVRDRAGDGGRLVMRTFPSWIELGGSLVLRAGMSNPSPQSMIKARTISGRRARVTFGDGNRIHLAVGDGATLDCPQQPVAEVVLSDDDSRLAAACGTRVVVWELTPTPHVLLDVTTAKPWLLRFIQRDRLLIANDETVVLWNVTAQTKDAELSAKQAATADAGLRATWHDTTAIEVLDTGSGHPLASLYFDSAVHGSALSADGRHMAVVREARTREHELIEAYDVASSSRIWAREVAAPVAQITLSADGTSIAYASQTEVCASFAAAGDQARPFCVPRASQVFALALDYHGDQLAFGDRDLVHVWDVHDRRELHTIPAGAVVSSIAFDGLGEHVLIAARDESPAIWPLRRSELLELACRTVDDPIPQSEWRLHLPGDPPTDVCR